MTIKSDYTIEVQVGAVPSLEQGFVEVADAFFELDGIADHDVAISGDVLVFSMTVSGVDEVAALSLAMAAVRTSIHVAGGATPGWEAGIEMLRTVIERESSAELV